MSCVCCFTELSLYSFFSVVVCRKDWGIITRLELPNHPRPKKQKKTISDILPLRHVMPLFELAWVDLGIQWKSNSRDSRRPLPSPPRVKRQADEIEKLSGSRRRTGTTEKLCRSWFSLICVLFFQWQDDAHEVEGLDVIKRRNSVPK